MTTGFFYRFESPIIFHIIGKDSERYLHARLTNDIKRLEINKSLLAACLSPQGKTKSLFRIYREATQEFFIVAFGGSAEQIKQDLACFIVADRVEIKDVSSEYFLTAVSDSIPLEQFKNSILIADAYLKLNILLSREDPESQLLSNQKINAKEFRLYRLKNSLPDFPEDIRLDSLFPEASVRQAISNTKGCYAGQEVVERVIALGKLPAKILTFQTSEQGTQEDLMEKFLVDEFGNKSGEVLSLEFDSQMKRYFCFARVPNKFSEAPLYLVNLNAKKFSLSLVVAK